MSSKRAPSVPPHIDGFEYVSIVGSGGFSDVFLYQQLRPRRRVAVKVLLSERSASQAAAFEAEADLMATLSSHPSIVTMYQADIASDGRPYLAMEYCSRPNLGARYRTERFSVAEALRTTIQVAGAVETAHRAGIIHRDIKPANILVTEYGHPALTDFGISSTLDDAERAEGMSIPWSPPEAFLDPPRSGVATDVWGLAATLYTLLAGRSPFEVPGGANSTADLVSRIERTPLVPVGRSDVPASLERILATAMAKSAASRYATVLAFARALQHVQNELQLGVTPVDLLDDTGHVQADVQPADRPDDDGDDDEPGTRLRSVVAIDAQGPAAQASGAQVLAAPRGPSAFAPGAPGSGAPGSGAPGSGAAAVPAALAPASSAPSRPAASSYVPTLTPAASGWDSRLDETVHKAAEPVVEEAPAPAAPEPRRWPAVVGIAALAVVGVVVAVALSRGGTAPDDATGTPGADVPTAQSVPQDNLTSLVPPVVNLTAGEPDGRTITFTWEPPSKALEGDTYAWRQLSLTGEEPLRPVEEPSVTVTATAPGEVCVEVVVLRNGKQSYQPQQECGVVE
ncbi:serine/threonine protein kinase [Xylanimonas cellulosilytica DSM 15894]|uniref:non-specific serine/threonine protein kinase n=1 Tax=Xylanimonas cellulosilytica (strain DSM 15894 / JCM 12276 / CECT 5975 / KCTC 9989 / LMG 20990 / NBRC 107835 / XIL07) TaxID=446471 RepID=D1BW27_XYLCX|nr:serine/threonine-protein kinase [Xylanimonas cellulosilytica]ACZ29530.1 serine/threonine protein kinase [Xylanimonas cellulosilytica DSM 15894]